MKAYISKSDNRAKFDVSKIPKSAMRDLARCALSAIQKDFEGQMSGKKDMPEQNPDA